MIIRRLIVPVVVAVVTACAGPAMAQGTFPAPLPGQTVQPNDPAFPPVPGQTVQRNDPAFPPVSGRSAPRSDPAFPPVNGSAPVAAIGAAPTSFPVNGAAPLTGAGFERPPAPSSQAGASDECMKGFMPLRTEAERRGKLIESFGQSEVKMIKFVELNASKCGIPPQIAEQLKTGHKNTETMQKKVCEVAQQGPRGPAGPSLSEVLGSAATVPEATPTKKGGSTFDTLNGNVLTR